MTKNTHFYSVFDIACLEEKSFKSGTRAEPNTKKQNMTISPIGGFLFSSSSGGIYFPSGTCPRLSIFLSNALERLRSLRGAGYQYCHVLRLEGPEKT